MPMNDVDIRALVDRYLDEEYLTGILVRLLQTPTDVPLGQTELAPEDPKLARYVRDLVQPELASSGLGRTLVDDSNNLICQIGADAASPSLLLMGYAVAQHGNLMAEPYSGRVATAAAVGGDEPCAVGQVRGGRAVRVRPGGHAAQGSAGRRPGGAEDPCGERRAAARAPHVRREHRGSQHPRQ